VFALAANLGTALAKLAAALFTGSSAMLAEAFHAFADTGNEALLLIAERRSGKPPDERHPLGHGRRVYFWALVASLGVFALGALLSIRQRILDLVAPEPTKSFPIAYAVLDIAFLSMTLTAERALSGQTTLAGPGPMPPEGVGAGKKQAEALTRPAC
jgi:divalent metal cation (Fe/Co/Zn/Cd) transporter